MNDTIAHPHTLFFIIRQLMLLILSKDQTLSRLGLSALLVIMGLSDLNMNFQRATPVTSSSWGASCVRSSETQPPHGVRLTTAGRRVTIQHDGQPKKATKLMFECLNDRKTSNTRGGRGGGCTFNLAGLTEVRQDA